MLASAVSRLHLDHIPHQHMSTHPPYGIHCQETSDEMLDVGRADRGHKPIHYYHASKIVRYYEIMKLKKYYTADIMP